MRQVHALAKRTATILATTALVGLAQPAGAGDIQPVAVGDTTSSAVAVGWKLDRTGDSTRLNFDVSRPLDAKVTLLEGPDRIVVDLPSVNFQLDPAIGHLKPQVGGVVRSFRFGVFAPGRSRIVIDLDGPAAVTMVRSTSIAGGDPSRFTIELNRSDRATFHAAASAAEPAPSLGLLPTLSSQASDKPVIVIDPGHGGIDPGASGIGGVVEKTLTFAFATVLADKLNASGRYRAVLTRKDDSFVSLGERVSVARDAGAALFVSVHADTLAMNGGVTGATVYTCSDKASDAEAARVAATENEADNAAGVEAAHDTSGVNDILFDLTRRETRTYAHLFQRTLVGYWQKIARLNKNPERAAGFKVLQAPDVPSVLLELGYLSSKDDVKSLTSPEWRTQAAGSVVASIDAFFAPRQAGVAAPVAATASAAVAPSTGPDVHAN